MVIDTSALICILRNEPEKEEFLQVIVNDVAPCLSAVNFLETSIVWFQKTRNPEVIEEMRTFVENDLQIEIVPFDLAQGSLAAHAYREYGKGIHPAGLNFGDCAAYALAYTRQMPLLYKGADFAKTGVQAVIPPR
jgi:ribonuclease VapC